MGVTLLDSPLGGGFTLAGGHVQDRRFRKDDTGVGESTALKDLGLSLEQVAHVLRDGVSAEQIRGMLKLKRSQLETQARELHEQLARVDAPIAGPAPAGDGVKVHELSGVAAMA